MDSILELQGVEVLRRTAEEGELPPILAMPDVAQLWADETGRDLVSLMGEMTRAFLTGDLVAGERPARLTGGLTWVVNRDHFRAWLTREKRPLPAFWFSATEIARQASQIGELLAADKAVVARRKSNENLTRSAVSVTDEQIRQVIAELPTRRRQAERLGITERQLLRRLRQMGDI